MSINRNSTSDESDKDKVLIEQWLVERGCRFTDIQEKSLAWALDITDHAGISFTVFCPVARRDEITISSGIDIDQEILKKINAMKAEERNALLWDLRLVLLSLNIESEGVGYPFKSVNIYQFIYSDGLTKDTFFQRMFHVRKGIQIVVAMCKQHCNMSPPDLSGQKGTIH